MDATRLAWFLTGTRKAEHSLGTWGISVRAHHATGLGLLVCHLGRVREARLHPGLGAVRSQGDALIGHLNNSYLDCET